MNHAEWKKFLIKRFLFILILVGISESLLDWFYEGVVFPWLSDSLHIEFFAVGMEGGLSIEVLCRGVLYLAVMGICNGLPDVAGFALRTFSESWAGSTMTGSISSQTVQMNPVQRNLFIWGTAALTVLILLTVLLPYVLAAFAFGQTVSAQINRLKEQEQQGKEEYDRRRNLLLSDVAHDLKTPMTTVAGYARILLDEGEAPPFGERGNGIAREKQREYLETIYNKSMQMGDLLDLLFEYVKLESEGFVLNKTRTDLFELLRGCVAGVYMDFEEQGMEVIPSIPEQEVFMELDAVQFKRVINNLLSNALCHNPSGTRVWVMAEAEDGDIVIRVCDSGEVIPPETAKYMFEPFVLGDESRNSKGGSGLGLSIARKVVDMHGGSLTLEQEGWEAYTKAFVIRLVVNPD